MLEACEGGGSPVEDLAREAWMLERAGAGQPCVAWWSWPGPVVVLGYAQHPDQVDLRWCRAHGVPVLRRMTGGTGVIHCDDLAVSLALPASHPWTRGVLGLYDRFLEPLVLALRRFGADIERTRDPRRAARVRSPICFFDQLADTLQRGGRKVVGCAQARRRGAVLIHASVLLHLDSELYGAVFRVNPDQVREALAPAVAGGNWRQVGRCVVEQLATALQLPCQFRPAPVLPARHLEVYDHPRWSPGSMAENSN